MGDLAEEERRPGMGLETSTLEFVEAVARAAKESKTGNHAAASSLPPMPSGVERYVIGLMRGSLAAVRGSPDVDHDALLGQLVRDTLVRLHNLTCWAMVMDMRRRSALGELVGATPEARFVDFVGRIAPTPEWHRAFFAQYPVLAQQLSALVRSWAVHIEEVLARFRHDRYLVASLATRGAREPGALRAIRGPLGDLHNGGRAVCRLDFARGAKVIYEPRSLGGELMLQSALRRLNRHGFSPSFRTLRIGDRGSFAWCEFIEPDECRSEAEVASYYSRFGAMLCLLYALGGRDVWSENVIASGEHPCLFDLECLMTPAVRSGVYSVVTTAATKAFADSVVSAGLLPRWTRGNDIRSGVNMGALHPTDAQLVPSAAMRWANLGRDDLQLVGARATIRSDDSHLPRLHGSSMSVRDFSPAFVKGFRSAYWVLLAHREEWLAAVGPLAVIEGRSSRILLRSTRDYGRMTFALTHSELLKSPANAEQFLEGLFTSADGAFPRRAVRSEIDQLRIGDIPYFSLRSGSTDLCDSRGTVVWPGYAEQSPERSVRERFERLSERDLARQSELVVTALATTGAGTTGLFVIDRPTATAAAARMPTDDASRGAAFVAEASRIGEAILDLATGDDTTLSWIGLSSASDGQWSLASLDLGLEDGSEGIALFLLYLYQATRSERFRQAAERIVDGTSIPALTALVERTTSMAGAVRRFPSAVCYPGSTLYFLMHAEHVLARQYLNPASVDAALRFLEHGIACRPIFGVRHGAGGVVRLLLQVHEWTKNDHALALAVRYGDLLLARAETREAGPGWRQRQFGDLGIEFDDGVAGIAAGLLQLAQRSGEHRFRVAGLRALDVDRTGPGHSTERAEASSRGTHGAAGAALGLLRCAPYVADDASVIRELDAFTVCSRVPEGLDHDSLYDGTLGNLDIALAVARRRPGLRGSDAAWRQVIEVFDRAVAAGAWRVRSPTSPTTMSIGLFSGLAGVGFTLLRLAAQDDATRPPQVLALEGPHARFENAKITPRDNIHYQRLTGGSH